MILQFIHMCIQAVNLVLIHFLLKTARRFRLQLAKAVRPPPCQEQTEKKKSQTGRPF